MTRQATLNAAFLQMFAEAQVSIPASELQDVYHVSVCLTCWCFVTD
jgi:hypothetical protein